MARTFDSARLRHQKAVDRRLTAEHAQLARQLAGLVLRAATARSETGDPVVPATRGARDALKAAMWEQIRAYYIGKGTDALDGANPRSPFALLLVEGIAAATRIQAERQAAIVRRVVRDEEVARWLLGPRPVGVREMHIQELLQPTQATLAALRGADGRIDTQRARDTLVKPRGMYEPFHEWVDPNGYRLSDRIWRTSIDVRSRVDRLLDYHISRGTSAVAIADLLEPFLTPGGLQTRTQTPYGTEGSYAARRLARTEITAAAGRATVNASAANPFVEHMQWRLSASHPRIDICDQYARGGPNGDGIYPLGSVPPYPPHPHCLCSLLPVPVGNVAELVESLRADIRAARGNLISAVSQGNTARGRALQGILNPEYLTNAMLTGNLDDAVARAVQQSRTVGRLPVNVRARTPRATRAEEPVASRLEVMRRNLAGEMDAPAREMDEIDAGVAQLEARHNEATAQYMRSSGLSKEELAQLRDFIFNEAPAQLKEYKARREVASAQMRKVLLKELELPAAQRANVVLHVDNIKTKSIREEYERITGEATDFVNRITAVSQFPDNKFNVRVLPDKRGRASASPGVINMSSKDTVRTVVHEIGHNIETKRGAAGRAERIAFYDSRTAGEKAVRLSSITPDGGYGRDEITKRDKWAHPYTGKIYAHDSDRYSSSEIISMGIDTLYAEPHKLVRDDPDFFDFLIGYLQGK